MCYFTKAQSNENKQIATRVDYGHEVEAASRDWVCIFCSSCEEQWMGRQSTTFICWLAH